MLQGQLDSGLTIPVFKHGDDPIDAIKPLIPFLSCWRQISYAAGTTRTFTPGASGSNSGKQRIVTCYNCKGEGHMSKQCTKPRRKRDDSWFKDKTVITHNVAYQADDLDAYDSDWCENQHRQVALIGEYLIMVMPSSEQSNVVNHSETEITSDSNIIPYKFANFLLMPQLITYLGPLNLKKQSYEIPYKPMLDIKWLGNKEK
ncbi:integrase, catalytic region, zinc finger, CCHC-type containing protein [Tanacetum coccineum]